MELARQISGNLVAFIFLLIVLYVANLRLDKRDRFNRLFFATCGVVLLSLILEALVVALDGRPYICAVCVLKILYVFLFSMPPILSYCWLFFVVVLTSEEGECKGVIRPVYLIPAGINAVLAVLSAIFGLVFCIGAGNVYERGPLFFVFVAIVYSYLLVGLFLLLKRRDRRQKEEFRVLLLFYLLPVFGGMLQAVFQGLLLMWVFTAGALIILYVYLQEQMIQVDSLTGAWTRRSFGQHLDKTMAADGGRFGLLLLDIDDFKKINDTYGHMEGDDALKNFTQIIKSSLRKTDRLARIGGDEFAIAADVGNREGLIAMEGKIKKALEIYNETSRKPYRLSCSIGSKLYQASDASDIESLMREADERMYSEKRRKK